MTEKVRLSAIVPVFNGAQHLQKSLTALKKEMLEGEEIIVVDDGSQDKSSLVAQREGISVIRLSSNCGPAAARNAGAAASSGDILLFVDADVMIAEGGGLRIRRFMSENPEAAAVIGSYDKRPLAEGVISQYRNLLHHYVHQNARADPSHFWTGLGAVRREHFLRLGGFNISTNGIEDVEFGYRLKEQGFTIKMDKNLQGKHLKHWSFSGMVFTDVYMRAVPWTKLMLTSSKRLPGDLSLSNKARVSVASSGVLLMSLVLLFLNPVFMGMITIAAASVFVGFNWGLLKFLLRERGFLFSIKAAFLHLTYSFYSGLAFLCTCLYLFFSNTEKPQSAPQGVERNGKYAA